MAAAKPTLPESLGFRGGTAGVHTSRTMMLEELSALLDRVPADAKADAYLDAVTEENVLGKPTRATRRATAKLLVQLYGLDPACTIFRLMRHFWSSEPAGRPMVAFLAAAARDSLVREATPFVQSLDPGGPVTPAPVAGHLHAIFPGRFKESTATATAQRLASTWAQAGFLRGTAKKTRTRPQVTPAAAAFAVLLGYLCGLRGVRLLNSAWAALLDRGADEVAGLVAEASRQGWLVHKAAGSVVEITFPGLLRPDEERAAHEPD